MQKVGIYYLRDKLMAKAPQLCQPRPRNCTGVIEGIRRKTALIYVVCDGHYIPPIREDYPISGWGRISYY